MRELLQNDSFLALLGVFFGGAGLKIIENMLGKQKQKQDAGAAIRAELRLEIESLRNQLTTSATEEQRLEELVNKWQGAYYDLRDEKLKVVLELEQEKHRVVSELTALVEKVKGLQSELEKKTAEVDAATQK